MNTNDKPARDRLAFGHSLALLAAPALAILAVAITLVSVPLVLWTPTTPTTALRSVLVLLAAAAGCGLAAVLLVVCHPAFATAREWFAATASSRSERAR